MALKNYKTIFTGSGDAITGGYSAFLGDLKKMKRIQKIKKSHDIAWYNEYLKTSKKIKTLFQTLVNDDDMVIIAISDFPTTDLEMIELYLCELYLSHDVRYLLKDDIYTIQLTAAYLRS